MRSDADDVRVQRRCAPPAVSLPPGATAAHRAGIGSTLAALPRCGVAASPDDLYPHRRRPAPASRRPALLGGGEQRAAGRVLRDRLPPQVQDRSERAGVDVGSRVGLPVRAQVDEAARVVGERLRGAPILLEIAGREHQRKPGRLATSTAATASYCTP